MPKTNKTYIVNSEQLEQLDHLKYLLSVYASDVEKLCVLEDDSTDLNIGFELGKLYSSLRESFMDFQELNSEIHSNKQKEKEENENEMEFIKNSIREWELKNSRNAELSKKRTAVLLKENLEDYTGRANLYELYPPLQIPNGNYNPETDSENKEEKVIMHVIVSGIDKSTFLEFRERKNIHDILPSNFEYPIETFIFESDPMGNVQNWSKLRGSFKGEINHIRALNNLGYNNIIKLDEL